MSRGCVLAAEPSNRYLLLQMGGQTPANASGFGTQPSQNMNAAPQQFGGFFGSSTDFNNPFGAAPKSNPLNAPVQPSLGRGQAPGTNGTSGNVPSVFNSIWSSEPADKKYEHQLLL